MEKTRTIENEKYFSDPDMPYFGYPKTEENVKAMQKLWDDAKPKIEKIEGLLFGTSGDNYL
jgi:hypothetical protein